ncbi:MAG: hypothetical protein LBH24_03990 [Clostridiales bacterium]|jgi:hypothetical protein|nr:hypothetical protein [Clostridiales bacterium]
MDDTTKPGNTYATDTDGTLTALTLNGIEIPMRRDYYRGISIFTVINGQDERVPLAFDGNCFTGSLNQLRVDVSIEMRDKLTVRVTLCALSDFRCDKVFLRLGADCFMERYPSWDAQFFPTFMRCERTHFFGCFVSPLGKYLAVGVPGGGVLSWGLDYNRANYEGEDHPGHRIYTARLDLLTAFDNPKRHPDKCNFLRKGEKKEILLQINAFSDSGEARGFLERETGAVLPELFTAREIGAVNDIAHTVIAPSGAILARGCPFSEYGLHRVIAQKDGNVTEGSVFVRKPYRYYLERAAAATFDYPQKPSTHCETYYGFFSGFLYLKHSRDKGYGSRLTEAFERFLDVLTDKNPLRIKPAALPQRLQNNAALISILVDAYEATGERRYIRYALELAENLFDAQSADGAYRGWGGAAHYTSVIYPAKSLMELYAALPAREFANERQKLYQSFEAAVDNLCQGGEHIGTEGEHTFEDGMITCSALQIALFGLLQADGAKRAYYAAAAQKMLDKHACLEQRLGYDARTKGCTLRFWESMYDVLITQNMLNSPHGWTSWKTYATYYLYLLTGKRRYLEDTVETMSACLQTVDQNGKLHWAFITDPQIETNIFSEKNGSFGLYKANFGECYLPMISDKWKPAENTVCMGYAWPHLGMTAGAFYGGACDNDVHEHFKCLEETLYDRAFLHEENHRYYAYNCTVDGETVSCGNAAELVVCLQRERQIKIAETGKTVLFRKGLQVYKLYEAIHV